MRNRARIWLSASVLALAIAAGTPATADAATIIDFDAYADGANLNGVDLGGVVVSNPSGDVEVYANNRFGVGYHSPLNAIGSFTGNQSINPMVFTFLAPVGFVGLWGGDGGGDTDNWTLNAYDAAVGGSLVGTANSGNFDGDPYVFLSISAPSILRVEAIWNGPGAGVGYDDLTFDAAAVPEPTSLLLLGTGLAAAGWRRRRLAKK
jgi:hypothetical protein